MTNGVPFSINASSLRRAATALALLAATQTPSWGGPPLVQLPGTDGCVSDGGDPCGQGNHLDGVTAVATSPDGRNVYAVSDIASAVLTFDVDLASGRLTQKAGSQGCVSEDGDPGICANGKALIGPQGVAVSPDGRNVYVASYTSNAVAIFIRDPTTGVLTQIPSSQGCVSEDGTGGACADSSLLVGAHSVVVSPDGVNVYLASSVSNAVRTFNRDPVNGSLTPAGCVSESGLPCADGRGLVGVTALALTADGRNLYAVGAAPGSVAILGRVPDGELQQAGDTSGCISNNGSGGECVDGVALDLANGVAVSADGLNVYVTGRASNSLAVFDRELANGGLTQKAGVDACVSETDVDCAEGHALANAFAVAVSGDGETVYVAARDSDSVAVLDRNIANGTVSQRPGIGGCVGGTGCASALALDDLSAVVVSPDTRHVYVGAFSSDAVAVFDRDVPAYDIDGDGGFEALTDGLLLLRHGFGFTGATLITGAVDLVNCTRCTAPEIEAFIEAMSG